MRRSPIMAFPDSRGGLHRDELAAAHADAWAAMENAVAAAMRAGSARLTHLDVEVALKAIGPAGLRRLADAMDAIEAARSRRG